MRRPQVTNIFEPIHINIFLCQCRSLLALAATLPLVALASSRDVAAAAETAETDREKSVMYIRPPGFSGSLDTARPTNHIHQYHNTHNYNQELEYQLHHQNSFLPEIPR